MPIQGSENYIWSTDDCLGSGAAGHVYLGRHRHQGDKYAIKVFNRELKMRQKDYIQMELDILNQIPRHENIVKFIAVEDQKYADCKVVVMEYCEGGSLQQILSDPRNFYGLLEEEFLLVLFHIGRALCQLHKDQIVHRDVKPGNILLCILADNSHVYKLTDFGTSTHVADDNKFGSLTGTEEYMHPDMCRDAFIAKRHGRYDISIDMWSYGITIYQCATGHLPFHLKDGVKNDRQKMQKLIREREPGVISQIEMSDGKITSTKHLPERCHLTSGTRTKIEEYLSELFDLRRQRNPQCFFDELSNFEKRIKIWIFDVQHISMYTIYLEPHETLQRLKEEITTCTHVPENAQLLFWNVKALNYFAEEKTPVAQYPMMTKDRPLIVIGRSGGTNANLLQLSWELPSSDGVHDEKWARHVCGIIHRIHESLKHSILLQHHLLHAKEVHRYFLEDKLINVRHSYSSLNAELDLLKLVIGEDDSITSTELYMKDISAKIKSTYAIADEMKRQVADWCPSKCEGTAEKIVKDTMKLYALIRSKAKQPLTHNDVEIQKYNKSELRRAFRHIKQEAKNHTDRCRKAVVNSQKLQSLQLEISELERALGWVDQRTRDLKDQLVKQTRCEQVIGKVGETSKMSPVPDEKWNLKILQESRKKTQELCTELKDNTEHLKALQNPIMPNH